MRLYNKRLHIVAGEVRSLLKTLTYPRWYTSLPLAHFTFGSVQNPDTVPRSEVLA